MGDTVSTNRLERAVAAITAVVDEIAASVKLQGIRHAMRRLRSRLPDWPALRIGEKHAGSPVVQGGMGVGISLSGLAAAVADAGGIGVIAANGIGLLERDYFSNGRAANIRALRREIRSARERSDGIIGVNIMVALNDFYQLLDVAVDERVDVVFMGAGLPVRSIPVDRMRTNGVKAVPIVSSARAAQVIFRMWKKAYGDVPDAVVCEGPLAGGHLGFSEDQLADPEFALSALIPPIVAAMRPYEAEFEKSIPVIAAGGIYTGEDVFDALSFGAAGVQMGTRFVATHECDADERFKQAYVDCTKDQIGLIKSPVGMPGRAIRNRFIEDAEAGTRSSFRCAWQCLASCKAQAAQYCISLALNFARKGRLEKGFVFAGANAYRVTEIVSVGALMKELADGFRERAREAAAQRLERVAVRLGELNRGYKAGLTRIRDVREEVAAALAQAWEAVSAPSTGASVSPAE